MKNENDLRVTKTRANILNAFVSLMKEKPLADINVKEICARAQCSRNTFYAHFPYKEAVLTALIGDCVNDIVDGTRALVESIDDVDDHIIARYNRNIVHAAAQAREKILFLLQYGNHCDFSRRLAEAVYDGFLQSALKVASAITADVRFCAYCRYLSGGTVNYILHWIKHPEISEEDAFAMLCDMHSAPSRFALDYLVEYGRRAPALVTP